MDNLILLGFQAAEKVPLEPWWQKHWPCPFTMRISSRNVLLVKPFPICLKRGSLFSDKGNRSDSSALPKESLRHFLRRRCCDEKGKHGPSKKAGTIFFLDRDVEAIIASVDTSTRPLLEEDAEKVRDLDQKRRPLYEGYADVKIPVGSAFKKTAAFIVEICNKRT